MIEFSVDYYNIIVFVGQEPDILDFYKKHASFIDDNGLKNEGSEIYVIISKNLIRPEFAVIAFKTNPVGYAGFRSGLHYENEILFIGAGTIVKIFDLATNSYIFEKNNSLGFWTWTKRKDFIFQQGETDFGVFNLNGKHLWETYVSPPFDFEIKDDMITLRFEDVVETRLLLTGNKFN